MKIMKIDGACEIRRGLRAARFAPPTARALVEQVRDNCPSFTRPLGAPPTSLNGGPLFRCPGTGWGFARRLIRTLPQERGGMNRRLGLTLLEKAFCYQRHDMCAFDSASLCRCFQKPVRRGRCV